MAASPEPTVEPHPIPTGALVGWWGDPTGKYCVVPAYYRVAGKVNGVGGCFGGLFDPPNRDVKVSVGQDLDVHMHILVVGGRPLYPLPESSDPRVIRQWLRTDTVTQTYRALSPGSALLLTTGSCLIADESPTGVHQVDGPCPVVEIRVRPIETDCGTVPDELCRTAAAEAILWGLFPDSTSQHVVAWAARPGSGEDWPGCGRSAVDLTITLEDPARTVNVTIGQLGPDIGRPGSLAVCTY